MRRRAVRSLIISAAVLVTLSGTSNAIDTKRTQAVYSIEMEFETGERDQQLASIWELNTREWSRYRELAQGVRGHLSDPGITPIEILGIHARSTEERRYYARRFARLMHEDTKRILAFQRAYDQEIRSFTQGGPLVDPEQVRLRDTKAEPELSVTDTILLFVKHDCPVCDRLLEQVLKSHESVMGIEIYFVGTESSMPSELESWLVERDIDSAILSSDKVQFQPAQPLLGSLNRTIDDVPLLLKRRKGRLQRLSTSGLQ